MPENTFIDFFGSNFGRKRKTSFLHYSDTLYPILFYVFLDVKCPPAIASVAEIICLMPHWDFAFLLPCAHLYLRYWDFHEMFVDLNIENKLNYEKQLLLYKHKRLVTLYNSHVDMIP